jgi:uncharacterized membrane protein
MNFSTPPAAPQESPLPRPASGSRARRRRRAQLVVPRDAEGRASLLEGLSRRAYPSYEIFVYAALSGAILGLGYILDSQALLVFGILLAPLFAPWIGLLLATITGSMRFFFETLMALLLSALIVFLIGALAGLAARPFMPRTFNEAFVHSRLWWPDLLVLAIGAAILTVSFVRSEAKPFLPNVMVAYEFFLPLAAGGFGLGSGLGEAWPFGLLVFVVHFAWAGLFGLLTLVALRFMPTSLRGFAFSALVALVFVVLLVLLMSGGNWSPTFALQSAGFPSSVGGNPSPGPTQLAGSSLDSPTPLIEAPTPIDTFTATSVPPTAASTPPPASPTITMTIEPTPVYAQVIADRGGGVLRETPAGKGLTTLDNFSYVQVLPDTQDVDGYTWVHVIASVNGVPIKGWMVKSLLAFPTPARTLVPAASPTASPTP